MSSQAFSIGFLMDRYESLNLETETSLLCIDELLLRGHRVYWLEQEDIALGNDGLLASARSLTSTAPFVLNTNDRIDINGLDALVIRKDPPFDNSYLHLTYLLDFLNPKVVQINSPAALRNLNEKLTTLRWPDHCPDTLVSSNCETLLSFSRQYATTILKPLDECSGRGIQFIDREDPDIRLRIEKELQAHGYLMAQEFLPGVSRGDKRIYLIAGEPAAAVNRIPAKGNRLANIHQGAVSAATQITPNEETLCRQIGAMLMQSDIILAGIDFIDGHLTEINITSPSAVRQINQVSGSRLETSIVDALLNRIAVSDRASACNDGVCTA